MNALVLLKGGIVHTRRLSGQAGRGSATVDTAFIVHPAALDAQAKRRGNGPSETLDEIEYQAR